MPTRPKPTPDGAGAGVVSGRVRRVGLLGAGALGAVLASGGCGSQIGDACRIPFNCGAQQRRQCDVSNADLDLQGEGECTIDGCTRGSCPREAVCVQVYTSDFLSVACDPQTEDVSADGGEPTNDCSVNEICLPEGLCADEVSARSSCRRECKRNTDCRDGYRCKGIGTDGVYLAPSADEPNLGGGTSICVFDP